MRDNINEANGLSPGKNVRPIAAGIVTEHNEIVHLQKVAAGDADDIFDPAIEGTVGHRALAEAMERAEQLPSRPR